MEKKEIRNTVYDVTVTEGEESRTVEGYALLFDTKSDGLGFDETIERGALDGVVAKSDVFALLNHSSSRGVLARSKQGQGSLQLEVDAKGLKYHFDAPKTALGDELLENLKRGEIAESSFSFTVEEDEWKKRDDGSWKRNIKKIEKLYDVSPVYSAAYSKTSVYMRGKEEAEASLKEIKKQEEARAQAELDKYYGEMEKKFN